MRYPSNRSRFASCPAFYLRSLKLGYLVFAGLPNREITIGWSGEKKGETRVWEENQAGGSPWENVSVNYAYDSYEY